MTAARSWFALALSVPLGVACRAQSPAGMPGMRTDTNAVAQAVEGAMSGAMKSNPHMEMTPSRPLAPGDSARAAALVVQIRQSLARYRNVDSAIADGFKEFMPTVKQRVYHFTNLYNAVEERMRFDPTKPTSLLYSQDSATGKMTLVGVMYDDSPDTPLEELNARVPLSIAHWHRHINWCLPPRGEAARWQETKDGKPVFGPRGPISTQAACDAVGGRFIPRIFGWMVHVNAFESDDPKVIWGAEESDEHMHM